MRRAFVSGIAGFLGSYLAEALLSRGVAVVGIDTMIGGYIDNVPARAEWHRVDCNDLERVREAMRGCDVVYHCAALAYEGFSVFSPHLVTQGIVTASTGVFSAAIANGVRRVVNCSSMARYGTNAVPFVETMEPRPQDPYGFGKLCAEQILRCLAALHDFEHVTCVPHNIIGPRQKYDDAYRNVASIFIHRMLKGQQPIIYGDGAQVRCFSDVADVVEPLLILGESPDVIGEVINVGPDHGDVTIVELAKRIARMLNFDLQPIYMPGRPAEVKLATCSADKARRLLGYEPKTNLDDTLYRMITWIRDRGVGEFTYHLPLEFTTDKTPRTWTEKVM